MVMNLQAVLDSSGMRCNAKLGFRTADKFTASEQQWNSTRFGTYTITIENRHIRPQVSENWASRPLCHT
jgi:hypothetical protein